MGEEMSRKPYTREMTYRWIFRHPRYLRYMARELSCLFIGAYALLMVWGLKALAGGSQTWGAFLESLQSPISVVFHVIALGFALYHSVTWFNLTPKAFPVQLGENFLPASVIAGMHFAAWALVSFVILLLAGVF